MDMDLADFLLHQHCQERRPSRWLEDELLIADDWPGEQPSVGWQAIGSGETGLGSTLVRSSTGSEGSW